MAADALSDLLRTVRLLVRRSSTSSPGRRVGRRAGVAGADPVADSSGCRSPYRLSCGHDGRCFATIVGGEPIAVEAGEVIVFTMAIRMLCRAARVCAPIRCRRRARCGTRSRLPFFVSYGGDRPASVKVVCGFLACDARPFNPLLENCPAVIKTGGSDTTAIPAGLAS